MQISFVKHNAKNLTCMGGMHIIPDSSGYKQSNPLQYIYFQNIFQDMLCMLQKEEPEQKSISIS